MQWALASLLGAVSTPQDNARIIFVWWRRYKPSSFRALLVGAWKTLSCFGICQLCGEVVLHLGVQAAESPLSPPGV